MTKKCFYCGDVLGDAHFEMGLAIKTGRDRYAHVDCIDSHGRENTMNDQTQHILGAADSAHQGIELARSLLQESLGNMGEILTQGCENLGTASLGSTMRLGQKLKELSFILDDFLKDAHGLCILLGKDLGVCENESVPLRDIVADTREGEGFLTRYFPQDNDDPDEHFMFDGSFESTEWRFHQEAPSPGEDEFDDDEQPF